MEPDQEITRWLTSLHLAQYASSFARAGYRCLKDLRGLTEENLLEVDNIPTGHRRRILSSLETLMVDVDGGKGSVKVPVRRKPIPRPRQVFSKSEKRGTSCQYSQGTTRQTRPSRTTADSERMAIGSATLPHTLPSVTCHTVSSGFGSGSEDGSSGSLENFSEEPVPDENDDFPSEGASVGFQGEMVENEIYEQCTFVEEPSELRSTRSYKLRHRPVPQIPEHPFMPAYDWNVAANNNNDHLTKSEGPVCPTGIQKAPLQTTLSPIAPYGELFLYNSAETELDLGNDLKSSQGVKENLEQQKLRNCVFQRRWVKLEGGNLTYYNSDKEMYSKGLIPISAVKQVRALGENKFEVVTSVRTFVFRAEKEGERQDWLEVLQSAVSSQSSVSHQPRKNNANKSGYVELRGLKGRVYLSLMGTSFRLCKTDQDFSAGLAITVVDLTAACVKQVERKGFEITTPFRSFCFTVESEHEREEWIEAVQESIVETLCNYEVLEKVWFNKSNRKCADCQAPEPEWASINLCVVICKNCADVNGSVQYLFPGQHRSLGPGISKIRSMKLDSSIWTNELIELFLDVGNKNSNSFWEANLPPEDELCKQPTLEQRASFIRRKYKKRKYKKVLERLNTQEELNKALCAAVVLPDILQTMALVFSGADVMCATSEPEYSTPYLLAQKAGQRLQMEFLYHNKLSDFPKLEAVFDSSFSTDVPSFMDGFLHCSVNAGKATLDRKGRPDLVRRWCTLEGGFLSYYENEKNATPIGRVDVSDVVSLAINNTENITETGPVFTFELYLRSQRVLVFGAETSDAHQDWTQAIAKCFVPARADALLRQDSELIGRLHYKEGHDLYHWRMGWFALVGSELYFCSGDEDEEEGVLQLKRLQELTVSTHMEGDEKIQVLLMVESGRIQRCSHINQMNTPKLACVFSSCLFQTEGHTAQETRVVEDLINNYIQLFSVNEEQVRQMEKENSFITRWKDTTFSPAGDLIFEVYLEKKEPEKCCLIKVSPSMRSDELAVSTLEMKGIEVRAQDLWTTFEVIENGEMERPLHYKEKVLEQVLEWSSLEDPSSAFLLIKKYSGSKMTDSNSDKLKDFIKGEQLKFKDGSSKLLLGNKFQDRYLVLQDKKLLLYKDIKLGFSVRSHFASADVFA
ncbi:arf-GAP with Rho-GAP ANK repeat and PH domain-containing 2 isoform X1 [Labeo rohita]|uniref:Arf-GAP with Rho-GAP ANK repeat and PH domain-containing 2 isoform X1 n=1 Tax=Labeo rohita TaxID=84645 RepID=A0A498NLD8_LABRO|nr:arf-GAP with Rho-GAP ANK repeat and PH domain-containing 2 isoform X1 [Labeo rohita]